ncbi:unnamed protein product [Camellia sinensis]
MISLSSLSECKKSCFLPFFSKRQETTGRRRRRNSVLSRLQLRLRPPSSSAAALCRLAALPAPRHDEDLATRRARRVRSEPRVDAGHVESMAALRQHSDLVAVGVLLQADCALSSAELRGGGGGVVGELRQRLEDLLLQAFVRGGVR